MEVDPDLHAIVSALARYLSANPLACDSLEGMHRWWFDQEYQWSKYLLEKATSWMKEHKLIDEHIGTDGRARYRRIGSDEELRLLLLELDDDISGRGDEGASRQKP